MRVHGYGKVSTAPGPCERILRTGTTVGRALTARTTELWLAGPQKDGQDISCRGCSPGDDNPDEQVWRGHTRLARHVPGQQDKQSGRWAFRISCTSGPYQEGGQCIAQLRPFWPVTMRIRDPNGTRTSEPWSYSTLPNADMTIAGCDMVLCRHTGTWSKGWNSLLNLAGLIRVSWPEKRLRPNYEPCLGGCSGWV